MGLVGLEGFIPWWWTQCIMVLAVSDWAAGRCFLGGVVVSVQWRGRGARVRVVPTGICTSSVDMHGFRVTVGLIRWSGVLGEGGAWLGLRCHAGLRAVHGESVCARFGTAMPLSLSRACTGGGRARAREWPTGGVGGSQPLGVDDGG
jgi:hypothetical protein